MLTFFAAVGIIILVILIGIIYLFIRKLVKKRDEAYDKIELMAITDELTQLFNRKHFNSLFENELARTIRNEKNLNCAIIEIDHHKELKDKYGQQLGDEVLQNTAEILRDDLRVYDVIARDDDRFICLFPETDIKPALLVSKRLRSHIEGETFSFGENDETIHITASIGITACKPCLDKEIDIYKIINIADKALDIAKEKGRNRVEYILSASNS